MNKIKLHTLILISFLVCYSFAFSQSSSNYTMTPLSNGTFDDMTGSTPMILDDQDKNSYTPVFHSFSMDFLFMGEFWNEMKVSPSGIIWFGNSTDFFPAGANTVGGINNSRRITAFAMNTVIESGVATGGDMRTIKTIGKVHYKEFGTAPSRYVTVEFLNMGSDINSTTADVTFQVRFHETNSKIELIYDMATISATTPGDVTAGFQTDNSNNNRLTIDVSDDSFSYTNEKDHDASTGVVANINTTSNGARKIYTLESVLPTGDATSLIASCLGPYAIRLDWTDNSSDELGFVVYGSSDGGTTFTRVTNVGAGITTAAITGLTPSTSYIFRVYSHSEGQIQTLDPSAEITTSTIGDDGTTIQSITSGNWSQGQIWSTGSVPTSLKNVIIGCLSDHTVLVNVDGNSNDLEVYAGSTVNFITGDGITIAGDAINNGNMNVTGTSSYMDFNGSFTNSGTYTLEGTTTITSIAGDFTNTGSWNSGTNSTVTFDGNNAIAVDHTGTVKVDNITTLSSGALGFGIPDRNFNWSTNTLTLAGTSDYEISSLTVDIDHARNSDIDLFLQTPSGSFFRLSTDNGGNGQDYDNVTFTDDSPNTLPTSSTNLTGTYQLESGTFGSYTGTMIGNWVLYYRDDANGNLGTLESWSISFSESANLASDYIPFNNLIFNNSSTNGVTLNNTDFTVSGTLTLTNGVLHTQDVNDHELIMNDGSVSGASSLSSHIDGPVTKIGNSDFIFPVGDGGFHAPMQIGFNGGGNATDEFKCRYFNQSPNNANPLDPGAPYSTITKEATIQTVSYCEYWNLNQQVNSGTALTVSLSYDASRSCGFTNPSDLLVSHWTDKGSASDRWKNEGLGGVDAVGVFNSVTIDTYSPFTLGATTIILPVEWVSFDALREGNNVNLNWSAIENSETDQYIVQRSSDGVNFENLQVINAIGEQLELTSYSYLDLNIPTGRFGGDFYYRIKQLDLDGEESYSEQQVISFNENFVSVEVFPNPFNSNININLYSEEEESAELSLWTMDGKPVIEDIVSLISGENELTLFTQGIASGTYYLKVVTGSSTYTTKLKKN